MSAATPPPEAGTERYSEPANEPASSPAPVPKAHVAPSVAIRAEAPKPKRLSRNTLMAGALILGCLIAFALANGLSSPRRPSAREESPRVVQEASLPESVRIARADYSDADLRPPQDEGRDYFWGDHDPAGVETSGHDRSPPQASASPTPPSPVETEADNARGSSIAFGGRARRGASAAGGANLLDGQHNAFLASQSGRDDGVLDASYRPPRSPYVIQAGASISAALVTALNSDQPGRVIAQVTAPVYDSVSGAHLLIPQGARLLGSYDSGTSYGEQRLLVVWNRLIMPNGWSIALRGMPGTDQAGASGLSDQVDAHLDRIAVASVFSGLLSVAANEAEDEDSGRLTASVGDAAAQEATRVGARIVDRELNVRPTLRVRAGAAVRVLVSQDIVLRPYPP